MAARLNIRDTAGDHLMHQVEIVDHQVEHGTDIGATTRPRPHAPARHFLRRVGEIEKAGAGKDKPLLMADSENLAGLIRERDKRVGFVEAGGDRFFDKHVGAGIQKRAHDGGMRHRRRADADEIDAAEKIAPVGDGLHAMRGERAFAHFGIGVGNRGEFDAVEATILRRMMSAERSGADHGGLQQSMLSRATMGQVGIPCQIRDMRPSRAARGDS